MCAQNPCQAWGKLIMREPTARETTVRRSRQAIPKRNVRIIRVRGAESEELMVEWDCLHTGKKN
ncbi:hypothetical protein GCM10009567_13370 [Rothia amarae]